MAVRKQHLPEPEELFLDYVKRMARHRDGREVLLVHMSRLEYLNRSRHQVELVTTRLGQAARKFDGRVFRLVNDDIACVLREASPGFIDNLLFEIRYGFSTDALVQAEDAGNGVFIERFDVRWDYENVVKLARDRLDMLQGVVSGSSDADESGTHHRQRSAGSLQHADPPVRDEKTTTGQSRLKKTASLLDQKPSVRRSMAKPADKPEVPAVAGRLDQWMAENSVSAGGTALPLNEIVRSLPICEIVRPGQPPVGATLQISQRDLSDAYARANGVKMSEQLEGFLLEEAETGLIPLLGSLAAADGSPDGSSGPMDLRRSVCLSPRVILSPRFLVTTRDWQQTGERGAIFWFTPEDLDHDLPLMAYLSDFLHDMGQLVGLRGLVPGDLETCSARLPQVDSWALKWPEASLNRAPRGETDSLSRALGEWGAERCFVQGVNSEDKAIAARTFGFRYAECTDVASVKLFSRFF